MKKIYLIWISSLAALFLSACGSGGSFESTTQKIIIPNCEIYEVIVDGDTVIQDQNGTLIKTVFDQNGSKKVCTLTGSAYILRK